jgi:hypothetical protein
VDRIASLREEERHSGRTNIDTSDLLDANALAGGVHASLGRDVEAGAEGVVGRLGILGASTGKLALALDAAESRADTPMREDGGPHGDPRE